MELNDYIINKCLGGEFNKSNFVQDLNLVLSSVTVLTDKVESLISKYKPEELIKKYEEYIQPKISCGVITLNEERCIKRCIDTVKDEVDEIIMLDFNSSDLTVDIAKKYENVYVYKDVWEKDFSIARNKVVEFSNCDWLIFIDADEYLSKDEKNNIRRFIKILDFLSIPNITACPKIIDSDGTSYLSNRRILNKKSNCRYYGRIHEEILIDNSMVPENVTCDITLFHDGYEINVSKGKNKLERNIELEKLMFKEKPDDMKWSFFLAKSYMSLNDQSKIQEAFELFNHVIEFYNQKESNFIYTASLVYICNLCLLKQDYTNLSKYNNILKSVAPNCADIGYFDMQIQLTFMQYKLENLVNSVQETYLSDSCGSYLNHNKNHIKTINNMSLFFSGQIQGSIQNSIAGKDDNCKQFLLNVYNQIDTEIDKLKSGF